MGEFWDEMQAAFVRESGMDKFLDEEDVSIEEADVPMKGKPFEGEYYTSVQDLVDTRRRKKALQLPVEAGSRVRFMANIGSVLTYPDIPDDGIDGTVVTVRTAQGDATSQDERVFVLWDDGKFRSILAEHLRPSKQNKKQARTVRIVTADLGDLSSFFAPATVLRGGGASDDLVHKATKDLWSVRQNGEQFVVERLFTEDGKPLKV